jgi:predicted dehydrogenase
MGQEHISYLNMIDGVRVAAIADTNEDMRNKAAQLVGNDVACFATAEELLTADLVDAYVLATPNHSHVSDIPKLFASGKPILIEKPLCTNVEDCKNIIALAGVSNARTWVAMEYRYMEPIAKLANIVHREKIGKIKMLSICEHRRPFLEKVDNWNRFSINSGGTLVEKCCHFFDLMRFIIQSEPIRVYASGAQDVNHLEELYDGRTPDILDNAYVIVDFNGGQRAMLELCMFAEGPQIQETVTGVGELAQITAKIPRSQSWEPTGKIYPASLEFADRVTGSTIVEEIVLDEQLATAGAHFGSTYYEHLGFLDMIRTGRKPDVSLLDGLLSVTMGEAAKESIETGQAIRL